MLQLLRLLFFCCFLSATFTAGAQFEESPISLRNASFEDMPRNSSPPRGWTDCGAPGESPPDVHPDPAFLFRVGMKAQNGKTFLGMVTRDTETWESVGQQLTEPLTAGQCYQFDIQLARSLVYMSMSRVTRQPANYVTPVKLRVWGGYSVCDKAQLLGQSGLVDNDEWKNYQLRLKAEDGYTHIILEAYYQEAVLFPYNGNLLLDNAQPLRPIACDEDFFEPTVAINDEPVLEDPDKGIVTTPVPWKEPKGPQVPPSPPVKNDPMVMLGETKAVLKVGSVFSIENIAFKANSAELEEESEEALQEIVGFMQQNNNVIVEIGGHASRMAGSYYANDLSENRAISVVSYLKSYNIGSDRLVHHGYGKSKPVCMENTKDCNKKNQRVEVKILKIRQSR